MCPESAHVEGVPGERQALVRFTTFPDARSGSVPSVVEERAAAELVSPQVSGPSVQFVLAEKQLSSSWVPSESDRTGPVLQPRNQRLTVPEVAQRSWDRAVNGSTSRDSPSRFRFPTTPGIGPVSSVVTGETALRGSRVTAIGIVPVKELLASSSSTVNQVPNRSDGPSARSTLQGAELQVPQCVGPVRSARSCGNSLLRF